MSKLKVDVEVDSSRVAGGLNASTQQVKKWADGIKGTISSAFGGAAVGMAIQKTLDSIDNMGDSADRMGRTIQEVQLLAQMAQMAGRELGNVELMLNNIAEAQVDALGGNEKKMATFRAAGFDEKSLSQTNELAVLQQMATAFSGKSTTELRGAGVSDIIGKKNIGLFVSMQEDLAGFSTALKTQTASLLDPVEVQQFKYNVDLLSVTFEKIKTQLSNIFLPFLTFIMNMLYDRFLEFEALWNGITRALGVLSTAKIGNLKETTIAAKDAFVDALIEAAEKKKERDSEQDAIKKKVANQETLSSMGPGSVTKDEKTSDGTKKEKPVWYRMDVPEKLSPTFSSMSPLGKGGFLGVNTALIGSISRETTNLLRAIEKNTRQRDFASGYNSVLEMIGRVFGITVK
jgi:hypothetical protein